MNVTTQRKTPQRTCIACRAVAGKRELMRVVRTPAGSVQLDPTGKKSGRGAYIHSDPACWTEALKKNRLDSALKTKLTPDDRLHLVEYVTTLPAATA